MEIFRGRMLPLFLLLLEFVDQLGRIPFLLKFASFYPQLFFHPSQPKPGSFPVR